ncbi:BA3454 family stress response protein [Neobacillus cucumis]|nr:BA3454 family stress response protein [Neobacillus cucumis]MBI0575808.1 BA3454 family stress response protein [Neobacillus cucumis]
MLQVNVMVTYQGKNYLTNVITNRNTSEEEIFRLAYEQVQKQYQRKNI